MRDHHQEPIGVIGLGLLGDAMAGRLGAAGYRVLGFDPRSPADLPVSHCASAGEDFAVCPKIIFSLRESTVAAGVIAECGEQIHDGHTIIDTTTGDPGEMVAIGETPTARGARGTNYVEADIAGSSRGGRTLLSARIRSLMRGRGSSLAVAFPTERSF